MSISVNLLRKHVLFFLIPILISIVYLGSTVLSSAAKKDKTIVTVNNLTWSCDLLNVEKHKDHINVSVQNNSNKAITAFVLTSRIDARTLFTFREEFAFSEGDNVIPPGQRYDKVIGIPETLNRKSEITLNLSCVVYEDGSSEGDQRIVQDVADSRLGWKIQIMKILPVLDKISALPETELRSYWNEAAKQELDATLNAPDRDFALKLNKKSLNNDEPYNESEHFKSGSRKGKETILRKYEELKDLQEAQGTGALRDRIIELSKLYTRIVNRP
ncbi:MAG: hypothetical protein AABO41_21615 [Acidobacteriota bacterium]